MYDRIRFEPVSINNLVYVWANLRERDKQELSLQNMTEDNYIQCVLNMEFYACAVVDGKPAAIFGYGKTNNAIWLVFFGTNEVTKHPLLLTRFGKAMIEWFADQEFPSRVLVEVWERHRESIDWLRRLGFRKTGYSPKRAGEQFHVLEYC